MIEQDVLRLAQALKIVADALGVIDTKLQEIDIRLAALENKEPMTE